ncbi:MAG: DUF423 domain-containing protein [Cyclobacteriaceae bacterium]|nr:DUF423 domain-containing protein [Cyclobacteriaceae bacterium]
MNTKTTLLIGALLGFLSVALGAFAAHALKPMLTAAGRVDTYELAVRYQFFHALALLFTGLLMNQLNDKFIRYAAMLFFIGIILFSGSLYLLSITNITGFAMITPVGGVSMLAGWLCLMIGIQRSLSTKKPS